MVCVKGRVMVCVKGRVMRCVVCDRVCYVMRRVSCGIV